MANSRTKIVSMDKMARDPILGSVLVRLMMVINDFSVANDALGFWRHTTSHRRLLRRGDALRYFVAVQVSHVYEGMLTIIEEIERSPQLAAAVQSCDAPTRSEFALLSTYRKSPEFGKVMARIRNNLAFHYDDKLAARALISFVREHPGQYRAISMGTDALDWYFEPGSVIRERVGVREVFKIPASADAREEADKILSDLHGVSDVFGRFAGNFIWQCTSA